MEKIFAEHLVPPRRERLPDIIASQIKKLIISKKISEGEKLPSERELSDQLRVSRVVIKQALMSLEQSGFVKIKRGPKGGAFVIDHKYKPFSDHIRDLHREGELTLDHFFEARRIIAAFSVKLAAEKANEADIKILEDINGKLLEDIRDPGELWKQTRAFHIAIADIAGNPLIKSMVQSLLDNFITFWKINHPAFNESEVLSFKKDTYRLHKQIIEAIKDRDIKKCEELIVQDPRRMKKNEKGD